MSVNMRQGISTTVSQQLVMTVQQQQSLKLLQCSAMELEATLMQLVQDNPLLEYEDATQTDTSEAVDQVMSETDSSQDSTVSSTDNEDYYTPELATSISLQDYLFEQLGTSPATQEEKTIISYLIGDLDENGYLSSALSELVDLFSEQLQIAVSLERFEHSLQILQSFDPPGIAARSLSECLLLQLLPERLSNPVSEPVLRIAREICEQGLEALAKANVEQLQAITHSDVEHIRVAHHLIKQLSPRPGKQWSTGTADYVVPDILTRQQDGMWDVYLNPQVLPKIGINQQYEKIVRVLDKDSIQKNPQLHEQLKEARVFLAQLKQRFSTILLVSQAIMQQQNDFFVLGLAGIKPLRLRDIAEELGLHESTISRATAQKYIATPHGVFELKQFFSTGLATTDGEQASATAIQLKVRQLIEQEPKDKPLSDLKLYALLEQEGIVIARRTITKYREALNIPVASIRKAQAKLG